MCGLFPDPCDRMGFKRESLTGYIEMDEETLNRDPYLCVTCHRKYKEYWCWLWSDFNKLRGRMRGVNNA
jgi:hypothetical protein